MPPKPRSATAGYTKTSRKDAKGRIIYKNDKTGEDKVRCKTAKGANGANAGKMGWRKVAPPKPKSKTVSVRQKGGAPPTEAEVQAAFEEAKVVANKINDGTIKYYIKYDGPTSGQGQPLFIDKLEKPLFIVGDAKVEILNDYPALVFTYTETKPQPVQIQPRTRHFWEKKKVVDKIPTFKAKIQTILYTIDVRGDETLYSTGRQSKESTSPPELSEQDLLKKSIKSAVLEVVKNSPNPKTFSVTVDDQSYEITVTHKEAYRSDYIFYFTYIDDNNNIVHGSVNTINGT